MPHFVAKIFVTTEDRAINFTTDSIALALEILLEPIVTILFNFFIV